MSTDTLPVAGPPQHLPPPPGERWTIADYERLPDDGLRYELLEGELRITPASGTFQQTVSGALFFHLFQRVQRLNQGRGFTAPVDVELGPATIVQPDLVVIRLDGAATITPQRIVGPPDLVAEIVSPGTASYDRREKRDLYAAAGMREYWIVDPGSRTVELLILDGALYRAEHVYGGRVVLPSSVIGAWSVTTEQLFG
jgi:Uma2 family endonuclease